MILNIGVTMRVVNAVGYDEPRDALAHDWTNFMKDVMPEVNWVPVPNVGVDIADFVKQCQLNGFILSGGNDIGSELVRDETESTIIKLAIENNIPTFGVCRCVQLLQSYFGGTLSVCDKNRHVNKRHGVILGSYLTALNNMSNKIVVNSYHDFGVLKNELAAELNVEAMSEEDEFVEAVSIEGSLIKAVMWHPEREKPFNEIDRRIVRDHFGLDS
jgi:gamma-glutamyl-gamma-aminobutyrate hydrolase PuuD